MGAMLWIILGTLIGHPRGTQATHRRFQSQEYFATMQAEQS
jgi:hypothetical protein